MGTSLLDGINARSACFSSMKTPPLCQQPATLQSEGERARQRARAKWAENEVNERERDGRGGGGGGVLDLVTVRE